MFKRAPKPTSNTLPAQRATEAAAESPVPAHAPLGAAARPRTGFTDLAIHPPRPNRTGLPDRLRGGIEAMSGVSMEGVRVHYNSARPKRLDALAFAQGREIHLAPGQEHHLPHEAWHLVQQAQGRVRPTLQAKTGEPINDDHALEREADRMGAKAVAHDGKAIAPIRPTTAAGPVQRVDSDDDMDSDDEKPKGWFTARRERTSFSLTSGTSRQGPHFIPHVAKRLMGERSVENNPDFDPSAITVRSAMFPSLGQARKLFRRYQENTGVKIPRKKLVAHQAAYGKALHGKEHAKTPEARIKATVKAMELAPMTTYAHGLIPTHDQMKGKGERKTTVAPDLDKMENMKKGKKAPKFQRVDFGGGFPEEHLEKLLRDTGTVSRGEEELSELDTSSDEEYDEPQKAATKKRKRK